MTRRIRVAVVFGGRSGEHAVSCMSAASVLRSLDRDRYDVLPVGVLPDGRWVLAPDDPVALEPSGERLPAADGSGAEIAVVPGGWRALDGPGLPTDVDVVFPLLHGPFGEDGTLQGLLEMAGLPYVGSGVFASAAAMDKQHMKALLSAAGMPVGDYRVLLPGDPPAAPPSAGPWFVKPARAGSSLGITKVSDIQQLPAAVAEARRHDPKVLVEAMVVGREIECGVLGGHPPLASVPAEVRVRAGREFYDFEAKYLEDTEFDVPAALTDAETAQVQELSIRAFQALGCEGLARVDFFLTDAGAVVNEINTMPGFTQASLFPRMWAASGIDLPTLVDRLVTLALERGTGLH